MKKFICFTLITALTMTMSLGFSSCKDGNSNVATTESVTTTNEEDTITTGGDTMTTDTEAITQETPKQTIVACVGDSITFGMGSSSRSNAYPSLLGEILGDEYLVSNFGKSGAAIIPGSYKNSTEYSKSIESSADIVIIMLGMNDANPTHEWNLPSGEISEESLLEYKTSLKELIQKYESLDTSPEIFLATTTPMTRQVGPSYSESYVANFTENLVELRKVQREVASECGIELIETEGSLNSPQLFADGCHLSDSGYQALAELFAERIRDK